MRPRRGVSLNTEHATHPVACAAGGLGPRQLFWPSGWKCDDLRLRFVKRPDGRFCIGSTGDLRGRRYLKQRLASWLAEIRSNKLERHWATIPQPQFSGYRKLRSED